MMDTDETVQILRRLNDDQGAPARVDLAAAVRVGRRRRRRHRITGGLTSATAVAVVIAAIPLAWPSLHQRPARPQVPTFVGPSSLSCTEHRLPVPAGLELDGVEATDPTGRYLAAFGSRPSTFVLWDNGVPTVLTVPVPDDPGTWGAVPTDIGADGTVVGTLQGDGPGWLYRDGRFAILSGLGVGALAGPLTIGAQGTIGGTMWAGDSYTSPLIPIMWRTPTSVPIRLPLPGGYQFGRVVGVDSGGTLAGSVMASKPGEGLFSGTWRAIVWWPDGSYRLLPAPVGLSDVQSTRAVAMSDGKVLVAVTAIDGTGGRVEIPYVYDVATGLYARIPNLELLTSYTPDVDPADGAPVRAGNVNGGLLLLGYGDVFYTPNTGPTHLPALGTPSAYHEVTPTTINDTSTVIAGLDQTVHLAGDPVYWTCR